MLRTRAKPPGRYVGLHEIGTDGGIAKERVVPSTGICLGGGRVERFSSYGRPDKVGKVNIPQLQGGRRAPHRKDHERRGEVWRYGRRDPSDLHPDLQVRKQPKKLK
ncbi:hypothetical protein BHM03_00025908 [Ensete ventricosum]|nr:hypothetical protein BHM03_00025908 [Ensete ventricosum]